MVWFLQVGGGDVNGDLVAVPASQLAVFPGTRHCFGLAKTELVLERCGPSWMGPCPKIDHDAHSTLGLNSGASGPSVPWRCW
jgi:hypothetical protein